MESGGGVVGEEVEMKSVSAGPADMKRSLLDTTVDSESEPSPLAVEESGVVSGEFSAERSSTFRAALNTVKSIVGVGVLSFPFALSNAGLGFGVAAIAVIATLVNYGMRLVVAVREEINKGRAKPINSYEEVAR